MAITGYQFDMQMVPAGKDASLIHALSDETNGVLRRGNEFTVTASGLQATVATGEAIIQGRLVEITSNESVTLPANSSGKICIVVDLTKTNSVVGVPGQSGYTATINQVYVLPVTGSLTQDNLNDGGYIYELPIATFATTGNSASIVQTNPILNDTGWIDATLATGTTTNGGTGFAQYRVKNGMMIINFYNLNCKSSANGNQILVIPYNLRPASPHSQFFTASNININTGKSWSVMVTVQSQSVGSVMYGTWATNSEFTSLTGATGTIIYPIN